MNDIGQKHCKYDTTAIEFLILIGSLNTPLVLTRNVKNVFLKMCKIKYRIYFNYTRIQLHYAFRGFIIFIFLQ